MVEGTRKPVLVTGHSGYIGSVMVRHLVDAGYDVTGMDTAYFGDCTLVQEGPEIPTLNKDIRDVQPSDLAHLYAVIHLAALSNDPIGNLDERWTREINLESSVRLAELAKEADVRRFLFSSSCIMYGLSETLDVDETSPLAPQTEYARSKVEAEKAISELAGEKFSPAFLRNGTIYGVSPHMRFDTVFNNLMGSAYTTKKVIVNSDGKPWRPVVHVEDVSRAFIRVLEAPTPEIHNEAFNTGANHLNHQIIELAEIAAATVPGCEIEVRGHAGADQRTYRADFTKFARTFPDFEFKWDAKSGAEQLYQTFQQIGLTYETFTDKMFTRLSWLTHLLDDGRLDQSLRWRDGKGVGPPHDRRSKSRAAQADSR
jgi:nucleoside-diphosphate-sugar epimerase